LDVDSWGAGSDWRDRRHRSSRRSRRYGRHGRDRSHGQHWRDWNRLTDEQLGDVFRRFYWSADPEHDDSLIFDPAP
jgi:hypothetical protein